MPAFLIQVSGHPIEEKANPEYIAGAKGPRFCDEPLTHGEYFNASPYWQEEGYGRLNAWQEISPEDTVLLYCSGSVDEHGACLSHLLTVETVTRDETDGARLTFETIEELTPKLSYSEIQTQIRDGQFSDGMNRCGQEGFNITQITESDVERVRQLTNLTESDAQTGHAHPDESLSEIADDYFTE